MKKNWLQVAGLIVFLALGRFAEAKKDPRCPAQNELDKNLVNAVGIKSFMDTNAIHQIGDLICCLPEDFRNSYVTNPTSIAGQNGTLESPRLLLFNSSQQDDIRSVISINGGSDNVRQKNNIEILQDNIRLKQIELYDLEVTKGKNVLSEKNPQACIQCHGDSGIVGVGGPHPNLQPFARWSRFSKGSAVICSDSERKYDDAFSKAAQKTVLSNPRFKCLSAKPGGDFTSLMKLDPILDKFNSRRLAKLIRETPGYDKFKFVLLGSLMCDAFSENEFLDWIPENELKAMNNDKLLPSQFRKPIQIDDAISIEIDKRRRTEKSIEASQIRAVSDLKNGKDPGFFFNSSCINDFDRAKLESDKSPNDLLNRYKAYLSVRQTSETFVRFLFESRGISTADWEMSPTSGQYDRELKINLVDLLALDNDPKMKSVEKALESSGLLSVLSDRSAGKKVLSSLTQKQRDAQVLEKEKVCENLRKISNEAFAGTPSLNTDVQSNKTVQ